MDSFELNKIVGAILGTLLFVMGAGFLAEAIYTPSYQGPGYELPEPEGIVGNDVVEEPEIDLGTLLASANTQAGEGVAKRCTGCHNFAEGAGNKQGPALFGIVGRPIASQAGFTYSEGMKTHAGDAWTYENLSAFLEAPKVFAPGTKMNFGGLSNDAERANLIAYLATVSPGAPAFPAPAPAENATAEAAPAVETDAEAIETPTTTATETPVEGTPAGASAPAAEAEAPAEGAAAPAAPATTTP